MRRDADAAASETLGYTDDDLNRITGMTVNSVSQAAYVYDPTVTYGGKIGTMTSKTEGGTTLNFGYNAEHIHRQDKSVMHFVAVGTHAGQTNTYDKNGNSYDVGNDFHWYDVARAYNYRAKQRAN